MEKSPASAEYNIWAFCEQSRIFCIAIQCRRRKFKTLIFTEHNNISIIKNKLLSILQCQKGNLRFFNVKEISPLTQYNIEVQDAHNRVQLLQLHFQSTHHGTTFCSILTTALCVLLGKRRKLNSQWKILETEPVFVHLDEFLVNFSWY